MTLKINIHVFEGHRKEFVLPDRNKYVNMDRHFLKCYMDLVVATCHRRGCHATGGMAAPLLPGKSTSDPSYQQTMQKVLRFVCYYTSTTLYIKSILSLEAHNDRAYTRLQ